MPYLVTCPQCATKLKSGQPVAAGRSLTCPQCKTTFTLTEPAPAIDLPAPASAPAARPAPPPPPPARPARAAARRTRDEDEDDRPRSRRRPDDEDDDRPRSRRRDEDEDDRSRGKRRPADEDEDDDRPRGRRRTAEDDDDERPRSRRRRDEEEDDEPPKSRKRRDADEDEEDRPKSRKGSGTDDFEDEDDDRPRSRGKKKGKKGLLLILGGLAALFLLCAGGGLAMYFLDPFGMFGGGASSDMLAWMPADTQTVEGIDVAEISKNPKALTAVRGDLKDVEAVGIKAEDVATAMQGKKGKGPTAEVVVVKLKSAADKDKVKAAAGGTEATANGKKYFKTKAGGGLYFASDKLVVLTRSENTLTGLLQKDDGKVVVSDELKGAVKRADGHLWAASVGADANMFGGAGGGAKGGFPGFVAPPPPKSTLMTGKLAGDDVNMRIELAYADAETARKAADAYDATFKFFKQMVEGMEQMFGKGGPPNAGQAKMQGTKKLFESMKITTNGSTVVITMTGPIDTLDSFGKGGGGFGP